MKTLDDIIEELYEEQDWEYDFDFFREVCRYPFKFLVQHIRKASDRRVRFMYFGSWHVMRPRVHQFIKRNLKNYENHGHLQYKSLAEQLIKIIDDEPKAREYRQELSRIEESKDSDG